MPVSRSVLHFFDSMKKVRSDHPPRRVGPCLGRPHSAFVGTGKRRPCVWLSLPLVTRRCTQNSTDLCERYNISSLLEGNMTTVMPYRISGHEGFHCRYTWLPKAVRGLDSNNSKLFSDEDNAMVELGLGKNIVRSARFWAQVAGMITPLAKGAGYRPSDFGLALLGPDGCDP